MNNQAFFNGGTGDDFMLGSVFDDTKVQEVHTFTGTWGADRIDDFDSGHDQLVFDAAGLGDLTITGSIASTILTHDVVFV